MSGGRIHLYPHHRDEIALDQVVLAVLASIDERQNGEHERTGATGPDPSSTNTVEPAQEEGER